MALTAKQERFVQEYLVDLNATQAAIRAGYSARTADVQGVRLLGNVKVQAVIQESMQKRSKRTEITQDWVLEELRKVAAADRTAVAKVVTKERLEVVVDEDTGAFKQVPKVSQFVELVDTDALTADQRAAISGVEETKYGIKVSTYDKVRALELIGKHLGMFDGKSTTAAVNENNLLDAIVQSAGEDLETDDLPEV